MCILYNLFFWGNSIFIRKTDRINTNFLALEIYTYMHIYAHIFVFVCLSVYVSVRLSL